MTIVSVIASVLTDPVSGLDFSSPQIGLAGSIYIVAAGLPVVRVWPARESSSGDDYEMRDALVFDRDAPPAGLRLRQFSDTTIRHRRLQGGEAMIAFGGGHILGIKIGDKG